MLEDPQALPEAGIPENAATPSSSATGEDGRTERLQATLEDAERKAQENWERYLRVAAEFENLKKRTQREVENVHRYALEGFITDLISVKDSLELGLRSTPRVEDQSGLREGMELTLRQFQQLLGKQGVEEIDPLHQRFNPEFQEAIGTESVPNADPETVVGVVQKGYRLRGRLLRPARVIVNRPDEA
jgi:molecular chaperone GrpE